MTNEVEIVITAKDLTGPAFASALGKMEALKRAARDTGEAFKGIGVFDINMNKVGAALIQIKSKIQSLGIADIADVNVPQGRIITQLHFLKRIIEQSGISDLIDMNVNPEALTTQLSKISSMSETIPVNFSVAKMPKIIAAAAETIPVRFAIEGGIPKIGGNLNEKFNIGISQATIANMDKLASETYKLSAGLVGLNFNFQAARDRAAQFGLAMVDNAAYGVSHLRYSVEQLGKELYDGIATPLQYVGWQLNKFGQDISSGTSFYLNYASSRARDFGNSLINAGGMAAQFGRVIANDAGFRVAYLSSRLRDAGQSVIDWGRLAIIYGESTAMRMSGAFTKSYASTMLMNRAIADSIPLWTRGGGVWGGVTGKFQTFGAVLTHLGLPAFIGTVGGVHLLADAAIELAAVLIPATAGLIAFGAAAVPTLRTIQQQMQAAFTTSQAFGTSIYPLTGAFQKIADAVKPNVMKIFGDALVVVGAKTGEFAKLAKDASDVMAQLAQRTAFALVSSGFSSFMKNAGQDLSQIGNIIGNIFGTIGNLLHVMPGYANILLGALSGLTAGLEHITANPIVQWLAGIGLGVHGFIVWAGLGATAAVFLGNSLAGLAVKLGFVGAEFVAFNAAQFAAGLKVLASGIWAATTALFTMGGAEAVAAGGGKALAGAMIALDAVNPVVWIGAAIGGLAALIWWLSKSSSATQSYDDAIKKTLGDSPVSQLSINLTRQQANTADLLRQAQIKLNGIQEYAIVRAGKFGGQLKIVTGAYNEQLGTVRGYQGELQALGKYQSNYNTLLKDAHGNVSLLTQANISSNDIMNASAADLQKYAFEIQAAADSNNAMALGVGRNAAAMNAQTNDFMTNILPALQKVVQAEDAVVNVMLGGQQAFISFEQGISTMGKDAVTAGGNLGGLSDQSLTFANDLYSTVLPGLQKTSDALQQQGISSGDLTKVWATGAKQILVWSGNNDVAKASLVGMINNALGPGTVSLKTLDSWIKNNSTSLIGMNNIIGASTIKVGTLANVLNQQLVSAFQASLFKASGAQNAIDAMTRAIVNGATNTSAYRGARAQLIQDLINTGMNANDAKWYVDALQRRIDAMHGTTVPVNVAGSGSGTITFAEQNIKNAQTGLLEFHAAGGPIKGRGGPKDDKVLMWGSNGEFMIQADAVKKYGLSFMEAINAKKFAAGGLLGNSNVWDAPQWVADQASYAATMAEGDAATKMIADMKAKIAAAIPPPGGYVPGGPGYGGNILQEQQFAMTLGQQLYGWPPAYEGPSLISLWNMESGWDPYAVNAGSGAYGIPQALPAAWGHPYALGDWANQIRWGENYIHQTYTDPNAAWAFEMSHTPHWYDSGGWLKPGRNVMYNGTGAWEHLTPDTGRMSGGVALEVHGGASVFEKFMAEFIREFVRVKGGGDVQRAFGSQGK